MSRNYLNHTVTSASNTHEMKFLVLFAIVGFASAGSYVAVDESLSPIVKSLFESNPDGSSFNYAYETGNGISAQADGVLKNKEVPTLEVRGTVRYTSPEGVPVELTYISNEGGFQATGSHIPVAPPVPEMILRSLKYIADHPAPVVKN